MAFNPNGSRPILMAPNLGIALFQNDDRQEYSQHMKAAYVGKTSFPQQPPFTETPTSGFIHIQEDKTILNSFNSKSNSWTSGTSRRRSSISAS